MHKAGMYIHIPFCIAKCSYCDFLSFAGMEHLYDRYVHELVNEINESRFKEVTTVYIGGGTPTVLREEHIRAVLEAVSKLPLKQDAEISIEVNPGSVTFSYLKLLKTLGVNRLSFGLQTSVNSRLRQIGRVHSYEHFLDNLLAAREVGFDNINVDLIFGLPGQTLSEFEKALMDIISLTPNHISFYSLTPCENTPLWDDLAIGRCILPCDETDRDMYYTACKILKDFGYRHYEISNAAIPGFECAHNIDCWHHVPYIGFGLGAHSYDGYRRWKNPSTFDEYFSSRGCVAEVLSSADLISEAMILGLRLTDGINESVFESRYGVRPSSYFSKQIEELTVSGLLEFCDQNIRLTTLGLDFANNVFRQFLQETK